MQSNGQNCCGAGALSQDGDGADVGLSESVEISPIVADSEPQSKTSALSPLTEDGIESTGKDDVGIVRNSKELVVGTLVEPGKRPRSRSTVVSSSSSGTGLQGAILPVPCCRVDGCGEDLSTAGDYHRRHKVCKTHATATKVINHGQEQRFCQQCSRFHSLAEFDEGKRSCRKRLAGHNERRRRHQPETLASSPCSSSLLPVKEASKKIREWRGGGRAGRRGRPPATTPSRNEDIRAMVAKGEEMLKGETSSKHRLTRAGEDSYTSIFNDAIVEGENGEEVPRSKSKYQIDKLADIMSIPPLQCKKMGDRKDVDAINIDTADIEQMKEGLNLGDVVIPPLPFRRDGKLTLLKGWDRDSEFGMDFEEMEAIEQRSSTNEVDKKAWQKGDKETLLHCLWGCPKVQPVWRWAGRQLGKLKGSKVTLDWKQAIFGEKMEGWPSPEHLTVWKLFRSIILWQIWMARKGKVYSGIQCSPGKIIRAAWVDLTMYAMQDWLEVLKAKGVVQQEEMQEMSAKFDNKWLVNQFAGKRADWSVVWKEPNEVLLD